MTGGVGVREDAVYRSARINIINKAVAAAIVARSFGEKSGGCMKRCFVLVRVVVVYCECVCCGVELLRNIESFSKG